MRYILSNYIETALAEAEYDKLDDGTFAGPFSGTKHQFMTYHNYRLAIPSNTEYSAPQPKFMIREIEIILKRKI
jgi:hypothetical protein